MNSQISNIVKHNRVVGVIILQQMSESETCASLKLL